MEISVKKFRSSTRLLLEHLMSVSPVTEHNVLQEFMEKKICTEKDIEVVLQYLSALLLNPVCTEPIAVAFEEYLLLLVTTNMNDGNTQLDEASFIEYQNKCVALAKLMQLSTDVKHKILQKMQMVLCAFNWGDQTDSKMLLGQYLCTDVPGEFIWLPGVLTQAVMHGYRLLLEDLDSATQDTYTILSSLMKNKYLSVPGFRDCVKILTLDEIMHNLKNVHKTKFEWRMNTK